MKKKLNSVILGTLLLCAKINAQEPERITGVWYLSQPGDLVGGGKAKIYILDQAAVFYSSSNRNHIGISFERTPSNFWHAVFGSADNKVLTPGIYKEARRNKKGYPILDIW